MVPFFVLILLIFAGMNAYAIWRVYSAYPQMGWWVLALILWGLAMTAGPFWARQVEHIRWPGLVVYTWLGILWWFLVVGVVLDAWNGGAWLAGLRWPAARAAMLSPQIRLGVIVSLVTLAVVVAFIEASNIQLKVITIETPRLPPGSQPVRVAMFSDAHLGVHVGERRAQMIAERLRQARPDILIGAGDLMDSGMEHIAHLVDHLRDIPAPLGKFAVMGNHEFYTGLDESAEIFDALGMTLLRGQCVQVTPLVRVCGVDDPAGRYRNYEVALDEQSLLPPADQRDPHGLVIFVKHRPQVEASSIGRFDIQLSGHSHGGQIWPFHVLSQLSNQYMEIGRAHV